VAWQAAWFCFGLGGFQLYDGTIQHKWWHLHQVRYHVAILPCLQSGKPERFDV